MFKFKRKENTLEPNFPSPTRWTNRQLLFFGAAVSLLIFIITFVLHPWGILYDGDDIDFHLLRFDAISQAISDGRFPFYIDSEIMKGYGYSANLFYPNFMLVPFALLIKPFGIVSAYKTLLIFFSFLTAYLTFVSSRNVFKNDYTAGLITLLYTFCHYRIFDMTMRNALGEYLAFTFIPLVLWGVYELLFGERYKQRWYILTIAFTCLILSHLISTLLVFIIAAIFILLYAKRLINEPKRILYFILAASVCVLLVCYALVPMYEQMKSNELYLDSKPFIESLYWWSLFGYDVINAMISGYRLDDLFGTYIMRNVEFKNYALGIILFIPLVFRLFICERSKEKRLADIFVIASIVLIWLIKRNRLWEYPPLNALVTIQFTWRLFQEVSFLLSVACAIYIVKFAANRFPQHFKKIYIASFSLIFMFYLLSITCSTSTFHKDRIIYTNSSERLNAIKHRELFGFPLGGGEEYLPSRIPSTDFLVERGDTIIAKNSTTIIQGLERNKGVLTFESDKSDRLELPLLYYKGYVAYNENELLPISQSKHGLLQVDAKAGLTKVYYAGTTIQKATLFVSILTFLMLFIYVWKTEKVFFSSSRKKATK